MQSQFLQPVLRRACLVAAIVAGAITVTGASDWPEWRGPLRDGRSSETNLPSRWSPSGDNLAWRIPIGGRSAPVAFGNRLYLDTTTGDVATTQERLVALDAESGKVVWERRFSLYLSDVPQHRAAWASPAVDPETGNIYMFTVGAAAHRRRARRQDPVGSIAARGIRRGHHARRPHDVADHRGRQGHPECADPRTGAISIARATVTSRSTSAPGRRSGSARRRRVITTRTIRRRSSPTSTARALLVVGGTDGVFHALKVNTGEPIWCDRGQQARHPQQRAVPRQRRLHHPRRGEHRHHRDGA